MALLGNNCEEHVSPQACPTGSGKRLLSLSKEMNAVLRCMRKAQTASNRLTRGVIKDFRTTRALEIMEDQADGSGDGGGD